MDKIETFIPNKSVETLTWHNDTFFTGLLRPDGVGIGYDCEKCIFIDRDPDLFKESEFLRQILRCSDWSMCVDQISDIFGNIFNLFTALNWTLSKHLE